MLTTSLITIINKQMRPLKQRQIISLHLEVLENVRQKLASLDKSIKDVIEKGEKWLNEDDNVQTFVQMNQMIVDENSRCLRTCRDIANEKEETDPTTKDEGLNTEISETKPDLTSTVKGSVEYDNRKGNVEEVSTDISTMKDFIQTTERNYSTLSDQLETLTKSLTKKIKSLKKRNTEQDNKMEEMVRRQSVSETRTDSKFDDVMSELHTASEFIKYQTDMLSEKVKKCEECNETILKEHKILESNLKLNVDNLRKQIQSCQETTTNISTSVTQNKSSMESTLEKLQNKCTDIDEKIIQFSNDLDEMSTEMIEQKSNNTAECFCVGTGNIIAQDVKQDKIGTLFMVRFNLDATQNHYDTSTGTYTTPYDGLFLVSLMIENNFIGAVQIHVVTKDSSEEDYVRGVCKADSGATACTFFPLPLKRHEKLFLKGHVNYKHLVLGPNTTFSCILISKM
ncbi:chromosome-associated kinesin KIF4-like isoform X3 [Biomphalaria glabrata]|uniref:Chromosome-associated kinesin KIF4-like isoform X3 n=1 Tax=Biomphalaria glabrata TaxID=6526 RepID=A0A9W3B2Q8_BIOGL|nr:chromosome-associated kinesin KIF4-like isoform X3 [Biomphalaria glabrata]